jgi:hypothetical protein
VHNPQAKGRVERMNGVLQDRRVEALARAGARRPYSFALPAIFSAANVAAW